MPKGSKKRAKLKKQQQQQGHPDDGGNTHAASNGNGNGSDDNHNAASSGRDGDRHHHLRIPPKVSRVDASEDSMESSEEMVTPRAAASEPDEEERKATAAEVPVESSVEADVTGSEEVMVDAFPPETAAQEREGKVDEAEVGVHAVVAQEPEVKDVLVAEESVVQEPVADAPAVEASEVKKEVVQEPVADAPVVEASEVKEEVAKVHPVLESEPKVDDVVVVEETPVAPEVQEPEVKGAGATVVLKEPETNSGNVVVKDSAEVSRSQEAVDVHTTEVARGPAVASPGQRATWWNCCGLFDAFTGSGR